MEMKIKFSWIPIIGFFLLLGHNSVFNGFKLAEAAPYEQPTDTIDVFQVQPDDEVEYSGFASPNASFPSGHDAFSHELYDEDYQQKWSGESAFVSDQPVSGGVPIKDDFSPNATDGGRLSPPSTDDLIIIVEYPLAPTSHQQPSIPQKSEQQKEVVDQQQYIRIPTTHPVYASEKAVRFSPPRQQKVDQQQYVNAPVVVRPISVSEKAVQHAPPSQYQSDQQQYVYVPVLARPTDSEKVVRFSHPGQQQAIQQRSEQQQKEVADHQQQYVSIPAAHPINASEKVVRFSPPRQQKVDQQQYVDAPVVVRPISVSEKAVQNAPPGQQNVDQQQNVPLSQYRGDQQKSVDGEHSSVGLSKETRSGKKIQEVKLAHSPSEHFPNEESVKFSFCKRRPDGYYRHPNDCSRILQCFGKELFEYPSCSHGLAFNERKQACDYHFNVEGCAKKTGGTPKVKSAAKPIALTHANRRRVCQGGYVHGEHVADPRDCSRFFRCVWGDLVPMSCGDGTVFNPKLSVCDYPSQVSNASCQVPSGKGTVPSV